jgi:hypothetical protein
VRVRADVSTGEIRQLFEAGHSKNEIARRLGVARSTVRYRLGARRAQADPNTVPVAPFREIAASVPHAMIAERLGWYRKGGQPDTGRVRRVLGIYPYDPSHGQPKRYRERITEATAARLCGALDVDPRDVGL